MLVKYDGVELDAAIINSIYGAYVESPFDAQLVKDALDDGDDEGREQMLGYQAPAGVPQGLVADARRQPASRSCSRARRSTWSRRRGRTATSAPSRVPCSATSRPASASSAQQVSNDWSDVNYSSARAALLEAWKTMTRRRHDFSHGFAGPMRSAWLEEAMSVDDLPLPRGVVPETFAECRSAYSRCRWLGPADGLDQPSRRADRRW